MKICYWTGLPCDCKDVNHCLADAYSDDALQDIATAADLLDADVGVNVKEPFDE